MVGMRGNVWIVKKTVDKKNFTCRVGRMDTKRIGEAIRNARECSGKTLQQVADELNLHKTTVQKWEKGFRSISALDLFSLDSLLGNRIIKDLTKKRN